MGSRLREFRESTGLSQRQVAEQSGISSSYLSTLEAGHASPTGRVIQRLAKTLRIAPSQLLAASAQADVEDLPADLGQIFQRLRVPGRQALVEFATTIEKLELAYQVSPAAATTEITPEPGEREAALDLEPPEPREGDDWNPA